MTAQGPGMAQTVTPARGALGHQRLAGVGDGRGTGVRHQGAGLPRQQPPKNLLPALGLVVFIVAHQGLFDPQVVEELEADPGVLGGDEVRQGQGVPTAWEMSPRLPMGVGTRLEVPAMSITFLSVAVIKGRGTGPSRGPPHPAK